MTVTSDDHLTEDQIFQMLLDPSDLSDNRKAHLTACSHCQTALDGLHDDLNQVEKLALETAPNSVGSFHLPAQQTRNPLSFFTAMRPLPRLVVSALALILLIGAVLFVNPGQENRTVFEIRHMADPDQLLSEIDALVETPFAPEFLLTTSVNDMDTDEDFMEYIVPIKEYIVPFVEYIVPPIENDPITRTTGRKGESLC